MPSRDHHRQAIDRLAELFELVRDFQDWGVTDLDAYTWFMTDVDDRQYAHGRLVKTGNSP